jgi:mannose-6-phosphate isomerase-like protein (cupin superfamily)
MSRFGDFYENRITGERVAVLRGDDDAATGESGFGHLTVAPHGAVAGEHVHPQIRERFIVVSGTLGTPGWHRAQARRWGRGDGGAGHAHD